MMIGFHDRVNHANTEYNDQGGVDKEDYYDTAIDVDDDFQYGSLTAETNEDDDDVGQRYHSPSLYIWPIVQI